MPHQNNLNMHGLWLFDVCGIFDCYDNSLQTHCLAWPLKTVSIMFLQGASISLLNDSSCSSSPCKNGGSCADQGRSFVCVCPSETEGKTCQVQKGWQQPCLPWFALPEFILLKMESIRSKYSCTGNKKKILKRKQVGQKSGVKIVIMRLQIKI